MKESKEKEISLLKDALKTEGEKMKGVSKERDKLSDKLEELNSKYVRLQVFCLFVLKVTGLC